MHFPELLGGPLKYPPQALEKCTVEVAIFSGMGATSSISIDPTDFNSNETNEFVKDLAWKSK